MSVFTIKLLAILFMIIDHVGSIFFPQIIWFRIIGRLAFPLFAWLIANGAYHTTNIKRYLLRLFIVAVIAQTPYILAFQQTYPTFWDLNVVFSFCLGLFAIMVIRKTKDIALSVCIACLCVACAAWFNIDYGITGVLSIICFYFFFHDFKKMLISQSILYIVPFWLPVLLQLAQTQTITQNAVNMVEPFGLLSLFFIYQYNGKLGKRMQYLFYIFYPLHLVLLYLLKRFFI